MPDGHQHVEAARSTAGAIRSAFGELLSQEFHWTPGHATAILNGCVFAPSLLTFWFVNGIADFSTAIALGTVASPGGLQIRLLAYVLAVPAFLALRAGYYLVHPVHRQAVLSGSCPSSKTFSLDWFTVGILVTGLPLAFRDLGLWIAMNTVFVLGIFIFPRFTDGDRPSIGLKVGAIGFGSLLFAYVKLGGALAVGLPIIPAPASVLGPVATLSLQPVHLNLLLEVTNSLLLGPPVVGIVGLVMNRILTHPEVKAIPVLKHTLPRRDPRRAVLVSAALGTVFYLAFLAVFAGQLVIVP